MDQHATNGQNRAQFFGVAAQLMRRILVDYARQHQAAERGGAGQKVSLSEANEGAQAADLDLLELNTALTELEKHDPQQSRILELRFFGGLNIEETAESLGISHATVERDWRMARAWLKLRLQSA